MKVGVVMPIGPVDGTGVVPPWEATRVAALATEEAGFDSAWVYDHLLFRLGTDPTQGIHECWTVLSSLATITSRVELGILVLAMPFRNPALLAKMAATFEEVSGGRLILGVGCGWHEPEFDAFGYPFDHRVGRFEEALGILAPAVRSGRASVAGRWHAAADLEILPRHRRPDGRATPLLIAGRGPRMLQLVARHADAWNTAWLGPASQLPPRLEGLQAALAAEGRDPASLEITVGINVVLPEYADNEHPALEVTPNAITGSPADLAAELRAYADMGVGHVQVALEPTTPPAIRHLGEAVAQLRVAEPAEPAEIPAQRH
jgi:alkanesulfonate monooxygenase SsuD/methylene tetrahydromethanopterin reductase-like flavin-dependent oxidoreductase (luciferase family)